MGLFSTLFSKKHIELEEKLNKKIEELEEVIKRKDKEISDLINELDRLNQSVNTNINNKQLELIEKNIKDTKEENNRLRQVIGEYNLSSKKEKYYYKVDVEKFFSAAKYKELVAAITELGIAYIQDMSLETFEKISPDVKNYEEGKLKFQKFMTKEFIEWEVVTYLNKGERVSKLYSKSRKLMNIFAENDIEFMEDLMRYDFSKLTELGFKESQIEEFIAKRDEYYQERRVVK
jgi:predicted RND superfamily exporter protein